MKKLLLSLLLGTPFFVMAQSPGGVEQSPGVKPAIWLKADAGVTPTTGGANLTGWANSGSITFTLVPGSVAPTYNSVDKAVNFGNGASANFNQIGSELSDVLGNGAAGQKFEVFIVGSGNANSAPYFYLGGAIPTISNDSRKIINHLNFGARAIYFNSDITGAANGDGETGYYGDVSTTYVPHLVNNAQPSELSITNISSHPNLSYGDLNSLVFSLNGFAATRQVDGVTPTSGGSNNYIGKENNYGGYNYLYNLNVQRVFLGGKLNYDGSGLISSGTTRQKQGNYFEIIVYNRRLSIDERQKVYSYLAIKYGIALTHDQGVLASNTAATGTGVGNGETANNGYYFASDGSVVFKRDAYTFSDGQDYKQNVVAGFVKDTFYPLPSSAPNNLYSFIGRDDNSGLDIRGIYKGNTYFEINTKSSPFPGDKQFMVMTSNNGNLIGYTTTNDAVTPYPASANIIGRSTRTWKITSLGFSGKFVINPSADATANGFTSANAVLLISKDPSFPANATTTASVSVSGGFMESRPTISTIIGRNLAAGELLTLYVTYAIKGGATTLPTTLPVNLTSFTAKANGSQVNLNWTTASEQNSAYFDVLRSADGASFSKIGKVTAAGNSTSLLNYHFTDYAPLKGDNYYKLNQYDNDGTLNPQTKIASAKIAATGLELAIVGNSSSSVELSIYSPKATSGTILVSNAIGQKIGSLSVKLIEGHNKVTVPASGNGLTIVSLNTAEGKVSKKTIR